MIELILGGVKSGKSKLAEQRAIQSRKDVIYIATAQSNLNNVADEEMQQRIKHHRQQRPEHWTVIEEPYCLAAAIETHSNKNNCILVDCLTLWMTNLLIHEDTTMLETEKKSLLKILDDYDGSHIIFVSNETNMGIIPDSSLARRYGDEIGLLHQAIAEKSDNVILTVAGLANVLKGQ